MSETRTEKSTKNIISGFALKTFTFVLSFVSRTVFIKVFGVEMLGLNGLFSNVISFLCLADLGFSTAMTYSYYKPIADDDKIKIAQLNHFYKKVYNTIALAITVIGLALIPFLKYIVNLENEVEHLYLYYIITLASTVVSYLFVYKTTILSANQQSYIMSKYDIIISVSKTITQIVVMLLLKNYIIYLSLSVVFGIVYNFIVSHIADKKYPYINKKVDPLNKEEQKGIFNNLGSVFLYKVSSVLMNSTDNIIISKVIGTIFVGYCSNYSTVTTMMSGYVTVLFTSMTASIGNLLVKDSEDKQYHIFKNIQIISAWVCIVIVSCVYALLDDFIIIWLGNEFLIDKLTVIALCVNSLFACWLNPIWIFREAAGIYRKTKYIMVICAIINVFLSIIMGKAMGVSGVLFASAISKLLTYVWYEPIILFKNYFKKSPIDFFASSSGILLSTFLTSALLKYIGLQINVSGVLGFVIKGIVCFVLSNVIFMVLYFRNNYFKDLLIRGKSMLKSKLLKK